MAPLAASVLREAAVPQQVAGPAQDPPADPERAVPAAPDHARVRVPLVLAGRGAALRPPGEGPPAHRAFPARLVPEAQPCGEKEYDLAVLPHEGGMAEEKKRKKHGRWEYWPEHEAWQLDGDSFTGNAPAGAFSLTRPRTFKTCMTSVSWTRWQDCEAGGYGLGKQPPRRISCAGVFRLLILANRMTATTRARRRPRGSARICSIRRYRRSAAPRAAALRNPPRTTIPGISSPHPARPG